MCGGGGQGQEYVSVGNLCILHLSNPNNAKFSVTFCSPISDSRPRIWYTDLVQPIWLVFFWTWSSDFTDVTLANGIIIHCLGMEPSLVSLYICTYLLIKHLNVFWYLNVYYKKLVIFNLQPLVTNQCMVRQQISFIFLDLISFIIFTTFSIMCSAFKTIFSRFSHHQSKFV